MAADPKRKTALAALLVALRSATGASYFHDLSSPTTVAAATHERTMALRESGFDYIVRVVEGQETYRRHDLANQFEATLEVELWLMRKWTGTGDVADRLNELIADCRRVVEADPSLAGAIVEAVFTGCDPPEYDADHTTGTTTLRLVLVYDWVRGTSGATGL